MAHGVAVDRVTAMAQFDEAWERMRRRLDELAAQERAGRSLDGPVSLAQAIRHVADWDRFAAESIAGIAAGGSEPEDLPDGVRNARWLFEDVYVSLDDALHRLEEAHAERRRVTMSLDQHGWEVTASGWLEGGIAHYRDHAANVFDLPIDRDECLAILHRTRAELLARLRSDLGRARTQAGPRAVPLGAAIAHVARWDDAAVEVLDARRRNADAPDPYADRDREWNARWLARDVDVAPADALAWLERASTALSDVLRDLDDRLWSRNGPGYALGTATHYRSHADAPLEFPLPD